MRELERKLLKAERILAELRGFQAEVSELRRWLERANDEVQAGATPLLG